MPANAPFVMPLGVFIVYRSSLAGNVVSDVMLRRYSQVDRTSEVWEVLKKSTTIWLER